MSAQRPDLVEGLAVGRLVVDPDRLDGREFVPAGGARDGEPLPVRELPDPDGAADEAGRIGVGFEGVVGNEAGLVLVGAVIARPGGDGTKTLNRGDEREAALFRVLLVEDEGVDLAAQWIEAEAAGPVDEQREFVVGCVDGDCAPDEGEVARVIERREAHNGGQLGAAGWRAHGQTLRMRVMPPFDAVTPGINGWRVSTAASALPRSSGSVRASASLRAFSRARTALVSPS